MHRPVKKEIAACSLHGSTRHAATRAVTIWCESSFQPATVSVVATVFKAYEVITRVPVVGMSP